MIRDRMLELRRVCDKNHHFKCMFYLFFFSSSLQNDDIVIDIDFTDNDRELFAMLEEVNFNDSISVLLFIVFDIIFDQRNLVFSQTFLIR